MPADNRAFPYLFKNDFRLHSRRLLRRVWVWVYIGVIAVGLLVATAVWGGDKGFKPEYLLFACLGFPYMAFGIAFSMVKREFSNGTYGWWLTLPYSRAKLMLSKFAASAVQALIILALYFVCLVLLEALNIALNGLGWGDLGAFCAAESQYALIVIAISPFMMALGLLAASVSRSKMKVFLPLIWILFGLSGNLFNWFNGYRTDDGDAVSIHLLSGTFAFWFWLIVPAAWLLAAIVFGAAVKVVKKHMIL